MREVLSVTDALAIYAAILSTAIFLWELARARPRIRPRLIAAFEDVDGKLVGGAHLSIQNISDRAVHLTHVSLLYQYTRAGVLDRVRHILRFRRWPRRVGWVLSSLSNYDLTDGCPVALEPRRSHDVFVPDAILKEVLRDAVSNQIRTVVQDELWNDTYSNKLAIDWPGAREDQETPN